jgi:hypothetical protein
VPQNTHIRTWQILEGNENVVYSERRPAYEEHYDDDDQHFDQLYGKNRNTSFGNAIYSLSHTILTCLGGWTRSHSFRVRKMLYLCIGNETEVLTSPLNESVSLLCNRDSFIRIVLMLTLAYLIVAIWLLLLGIFEIFRMPFGNGLLRASKIFVYANIMTINGKKRMMAALKTS